MSKLVALNQMKPGESYKGYEGGLYGNYSNTIPDAYLELGMKVASELARDSNIALGTIGASSLSMESMQIFTKLKSIPGIRKDLRMVNACKGGTTYEKMDERYWQFVRDAFAQNGVKLKDVKIIILKSDTLTNNAPDTIEYVRNLIDATVLRMKKADLFPNLKIVLFTGRNGTNWVPATDVKHAEPRAFNNGVATREFIVDHIKFSEKELASGIFVDWLFYAWTDGVNRRDDGWLWPQNFTQDAGVHPSPVGREQFAIAIKNAIVKNPIALVWMKITEAVVEASKRDIEEQVGEGAKKQFNPDEEFNRDDVDAETKKGRFEWIGDSQAEGVRFIEDVNGPLTYIEFRELYPYEISEGVYSEDDAHATQIIDHTTTQEDIDANPDAGLKVGEEIKLPVTDFEKEKIETAKASDLPSGETDKPVAEAAKSEDNAEDKSNSDLTKKEDSKTNIKKTDKKNAGNKK